MLPARLVLRRPARPHRGRAGEDGGAGERVTAGRGMSLEDAAVAAARGDARSVAERLLEHGVVTLPTSTFGREFLWFLRVSFCADLPVITEGVRRMKDPLTNV